MLCFPSKRSESGSGCVLVGAEISSTWTTLSSSICSVCLFPETLVWCLWWKNGDLPKGLKAGDKGRADVDVGELVRAGQCWQNSTSKENLVLLVYILLS